MLYLDWTGSSNFLTGFALHMKYVGLPNPTYVRVFNINSSHPVDLAKVTYSYIYISCLLLTPTVVKWGRDQGHMTYFFKFWDLIHSLKL